MDSAYAPLEDHVTSLMPVKVPGGHLDFRIKGGTQYFRHTGTVRQELIKQTFRGVWSTWLPQPGCACIPPANLSCLSLSDPHLLFPKMPGEGSAFKCKI